MKKRRISVCSEKVHQKTWQKNKKSWTSYQITVPLVREYLKQVATGGTTSATNTPGIYDKIVDAHDLRVEAAFLSN